MLNSEPPEPIPEALAAPKAGRSFALVWIVPVVALAIGAWLALSSWFERGPVIEIHFRTAEGLQVGQVAAYALEGDGKAVKVTIFINAPYDRFVSAASRFWHASGIDFALDAEGVRMKTESLVSLAIGGIAFDTPRDEAEPAPLP